MELFLTSDYINLSLGLWFNFKYKFSVKGNMLSIYIKPLVLAYSCVAPKTSILLMSEISVMEDRLNLNLYIYSLIFYKFTLICISLLNVMLTIFLLVFTLVICPILASS